MCYAVLYRGECEGANSRELLFETQELANEACNQLNVGIEDPSHDNCWYVSKLSTYPRVYPQLTPVWEVRVYGNGQGEMVGQARMVYVSPYRTHAFISSPKGVRLEEVTAIICSPDRDLAVEEALAYVKQKVEGGHIEIRRTKGATGTTSFA